MRSDTTTEYMETTGRLVRTLETDPASLAFVALAQIRLDEGDCEEAIALCRTGLEKHPNHSTGHLIHGMSLKAAGRTDEAIREFREVTNLDPGNRIAIQQLGESYRQAAGPETESARPMPHDEIEEEPNAGDEIAFFTNSMAEVYESQGFFEKALSIYRRLLTLQPHRDDVREKIRNLEQKMGVA